MSTRAGRAEERAGAGWLLTGIARRPEHSDWGIAFEGGGVLAQGLGARIWYLVVVRCFLVGLKGRGRLTRLHLEGSKDLVFLRNPT